MRTRAMATTISLGMAATFTGFSASTANAYTNSDLSVSSWSRYTVECPCSDNSGLDFTEFKYDSGGKGLKLVVKKNNSPVAQVEFHPSDEILYVYDGKNDGDTIYVRAMWWEGSGFIKEEGTYWAPGTSAELDMNKVEMDDNDDIDEGTVVYFRLFDDKALTDPITDWYQYNGKA
ncbi:hypothetical protein ACIPH4_40400 [Streptomyces tendae]|uniref:hypothetical protein n=1 Tax=Streptomyces tendae TaxID=1932 RepID=UPI00368A7A5A